MLVDVTESQQRDLHMYPMMSTASRRQRLSIKCKNLEKYCKVNKTQGRLPTNASPPPPLVQRWRFKLSCTFDNETRIIK